MYTYVIGFMFSNGCHCPPWYQLYGDIDYIIIDPWDSDTLCVTASLEGYYEDKVNNYNYYCCCCYY